MMTKEEPSQARDDANVGIGADQQAASLGIPPTSGQLIFNAALAVFGLFVAALMFVLGINWANQGSILAGVGVISAALFIFWRGGNRVSWICAELKMRRPK
jgi:small-conductance mechanosensitive channel